MEPTAPRQADAVQLKVQHVYAFEHALLEGALHEPAAGAPRVPEAFVQDLWRAQRFSHTDILTSGGTAVTVLDPGAPNPDGGPDFLGARLRIGEVEWAGDVEIHVTSGEWFTHKHHLDARYNSVVLHVALHADIWTGGLLRADGSPLQELILYPHLEAPIRKLLHQFYTRPQEDLLCASSWASVPEDLRQAWIEELAHERLTGREAQLARYGSQEKDLENLLHQRLFAALGYAKNAAPLEALALRLPLSLVRRYEDPLDLEALHFGVAGLLPTPADMLASDRATADYVMELRDRFERLNHRLELPVMARSVWQFFRLRPANFPPLRIAQAVALLGPDGLLHRDPIDLLVQVLHASDPVKALRETLRVRPGPFWCMHVRLERATRARPAVLGHQRIDALITNAVVPVMLRYAGIHRNLPLRETLLDVLHRLPPDRDAVMRRFSELGTTPEHAFAAQGLHQLYRTRCSQARCLSCTIGRFLLEHA